MKKTFQELYDETLIADLGEEGNICDISIDKLRSPTMKKLHKASCSVGKKEKDSAMRRAGKRAGLSRSARDKLYNSVEEGYQEISNLVDITQEVMLKMIKAMKKDDFRAVTKLYKELGNIIK